MITVTRSKPLGDRAPATDSAGEPKVARTYGYSHAKAVIHPSNLNASLIRRAADNHALLFAPSANGSFRVSRSGTRARVPKSVEGRSLSSHARNSTQFQSRDSGPVRAVVNR